MSLCSPIDCLPNELLLFLFGWLAGTCSALASCRATCRSWKDAIAALGVLRPYQLDVCDTEGSLLVRPALGSCINEVNYGWKIRNLWKFLSTFIRDAEGCIGLQTLKVDDCIISLNIRCKRLNAGSIASDILTLARSCPDIAELTFPCCIFRHLAHSDGLRPGDLPTVQRLHIRASCHREILWPASRLGGLRVLELFGVQFLDNSFALLASLPNLEELHCFAMHLFSGPVEQMSHLLPGLVRNARDLVLRAPVLRVLTLQFLTTWTRIVNMALSSNNQTWYGPGLCEAAAASRGPGLCEAAASRGLLRLTLGIDTSLAPFFAEELAQQYPFLRWIEPAEK